MLVLPSSASAALGGDETTVQADQARMKGTLRNTPTNAYTVQEIKAPTGTVVKRICFSGWKDICCSLARPVFTRLAPTLRFVF